MTQNRPEIELCLCVRMKRPLNRSPQTVLDGFHRPSWSLDPGKSSNQNLTHTEENTPCHNIVAFAVYLTQQQKHVTNATSIYLNGQHPKAATPEEEQELSSVHSRPVKATPSTATILARV